MALRSSALLSILLPLGRGFFDRDGDGSAALEGVSGGDEEDDAPDDERATSAILLLKLLVGRTGSSSRHKSAHCPRRVDRLGDNCI